MICTTRSYGHYKSSGGFGYCLGAEETQKQLISLPQ